MSQERAGVFMSEQELQARMEQAKAERRAQAVSKLLSEPVRETPLGRLLAKAGGGLDYTEELAGFVEEQWIAYQAGQELRADRQKRSREEEAEAEAEDRKA